MKEINKKRKNSIKKDQNRRIVKNKLKNIKKL